MTDTSNHHSSEGRNRLFTLRRVTILTLVSIAGWFLFWPAEKAAPPTGPHNLVLRVGDVIERLSFSSDSRRLLVGMPTRAVIWNALSGDVVRSLEDSGYSGMGIAAFGVDGRTIVTKPVNTALLWDADTGQRLATFVGHEYAIEAAVLSSDGRHLITTGRDKTARIWDADNLRPPSTWISPIEIRRPRITLARPYVFDAATFSPDGRRVVVVARVDHIAELWNADTWQLIAVFRAEGGDMSQAIFTPDGQRILTLSPKRVQIWSANDGRPLVRLDAGPSQTFRRAAISPDGRWIATADDRLAVWDAETGRALATTARSAHFSDVRFSPDGRRIATTSFDGVVQLWDSETASVLTTLPGAAGMALNPTFSPDGRYFAASFPGPIVKIWPLIDGAPHHDPNIATIVRRESPDLVEWFSERYRLARRRLGFGG